MDSQFDPPKTIGDAKYNIRKIKEIQERLIRQGRHREALKWDEDLAFQQQALEELRR